MAEHYEVPDGQPSFPEYEHPPSSNKPKVVPKKKQRDSTALRKAPQAPKRFKSSYICFFIDKQPEVKQMLGPKATVAEVSKRSAELWRNLPAEERAHWDEIAAKDKARYMVEKATYTGPWQVPRARAKKDPSAPKRPMSAFLYFSQDKRRQIKAENPDLRNTEISRKLGQLWRNASEEERAPHVAMEKAERERYKIRIEKWRDEYDDRMEEQRKIQAEQAAHAATVYGVTNLQQESVQSNEQAQQYNFAAATASGGFDASVMSQQQQQYMGQQQQAGQAYPYPVAPGSFQGYAMAYGYNAAGGAQGQFANGRPVVVLGPNGMPVYQPQTFTASSNGQVEQAQIYEGAPPQQQVSYDYGDQAALKSD